MAKRTVHTTLASYFDVEGNRRIGRQGEEVDVHPDHIAHFDKANVGVTAPAAAPAAAAAPEVSDGAEPDNKPRRARRVE
jgi:hypothetical protein